MIASSARKDPRHPGRILREEFLRRIPGTQAEVAGRLGMTRVRLNELVREKRGVTPDTAIRLARAFGTTPEFWMEAQAAWDLHLARRSRRLRRDVEQIEPLVAAPREAAARTAAVAPAPRTEAPAEPDAPSISRFYEQFLERKGLLEDARRFVRTQAQVEAPAPRLLLRPRRVRLATAGSRFPVQGELRLG